MPQTIRHKTELGAWLPAVTLRFTPERFQEAGDELAMVRSALLCGTPLTVPLEV